MNEINIKKIILGVVLLFCCFYYLIYSIRKKNFKNLSKESMLFPSQLKIYFGFLGLFITSIILIINELIKLF